MPHLGGTEARLHTAPQGGLSPTCHLVYALSTDWTAAGQSGLRVPQHIQHRWPVNICLQGQQQLAPPGRPVPRAQLLGPRAEEDATALSCTEGAGARQY